MVLTYTHMPRLRFWKGVTIFFIYVKVEVDMLDI